jgi:hypothetical protein
MCQWAWKSYVTPRGETLVKEWHGEVDSFVWLEFRTTLEYLDGQPPSNWVRPYVGTLKKDCSGLFEIRLEVKNVQYRPIGYYSGEMEFTILFFAIEKGSKFVPLAACEIAQRRRKDIEEGKEKANEFWFKKRDGSKHRCK